MQEDRRAHLDRILESSDALKVIVAGPGTGKTHAFKTIVDRAEGPVVVLSFLNNLVADLHAAMGDRAEVRTFHRFCRARLHHMEVPGITHDVDYYPSFRLISEEDLT